MLQIEMNKLRCSFGSSKTEACSKNSLKWSDLTTGLGRKALTIGIVLAALNQFCGCFAMLNYTANIFKEAGSNMSPNLAAILVGVIQLVGSYAATVLVDRAGRKVNELSFKFSFDCRTKSSGTFFRFFQFLFIASTVGTALGLTTLGVYMMFKSWHYSVEAFNWVPIASFSFVIFIASWAILTLPFLVISEIMPEKLKGFGVSFCMTLLWIFAFIILKYLPLLIESLTFHGSMFAFAGVCVSSALFIVFRMPETKGKSYEEIMSLL